MRVSGMVDENENLCDLPFSISTELAACLQVSNRWKTLLESLEKVTAQHHFHFSSGDVALFEQHGVEAAKKVLWKLGERGMTVGELKYFFEILKWEQELRLLKLPERVKIEVQPETKILVTEGERVSLTCKATGFPYPRYEWLVSKNTGEAAKQVNHPTAINSQLVIPCVTVNDDGKYVCRVINDYSYEDSTWVKLTVEQGDPDLVRRRLEEIAAADNTIERFDSGEPLSHGVTAYDGIDGPLGNLRIWERPNSGAPLMNSAGNETGPYITGHPSQEPIHVQIGQSVVMCVEAHANPPPVYRWYRKHRDRGSVHPVENGQQHILRIPKANETHNGNYFCEVSNHISSVESKECQLHVYSAACAESPKIIYEPTSQTQMVDGLVTMEVTAKGKGPLTYQWFKDGRELPGETAKRLEFRIKSGKDAGSFQCLVKCPQTGGKIMSNARKPARLDVKYPPKHMAKYRAQDKVALVIGESHYQIYGEVLEGSKFDAREMTLILSSLGFKVISLLDPSKQEILRAVELFCEMLETPSDKGTAHHSGMYGVFYWAGHGCYHLGDSYLIPYNVGLPTKLDDCISVEYIRSKMLRTDPSLCLLLLDMCRGNDSAIIMPRDYKAHIEGKKVRGRDHDNVPYGNHCTIYATSIGQEAFEIKMQQCSIFMKCFRKAIQKQSNLSELYEDILEELRKEPKADKKQNPEKVSNIKENRSLHDEIVSDGFTNIVTRRQAQWQNTHTLPDVQHMRIDPVGIRIEVHCEDFLSNVMIIRVVVMELGKAEQINKMVTYHDPQKVDIVDCGIDYGTENTWRFQISALQRLTTDLKVVFKLQYTVLNQKQCDAHCALNLGRPLIAGSELWSESLHVTEIDGLEGEGLGATAGAPFAPYTGGRHNNWPDVYGQPSVLPGEYMPHLQFQTPQNNYGGNLHSQGSHDQRVELAAANRICHPEQEDQPGRFHEGFPHKQFSNYFQ